MALNGEDTDQVAAAEAAPVELPTGVVTFLLTDIEGSSGLWESDPDAMAASLELHDGLIAAVAEANAGRLLKTKGEGDSTLTVFRRASDAVAAATELRATLGRRHLARRARAARADRDSHRRSA